MNEMKNLDHLIRHKSSIHPFDDVIEKLKNHQYGLILIKTPLHWYKTKSVDQVESRVVILLDVRKEYLNIKHSDNTAVATQTAYSIFSKFDETFVVHVILNGIPHQMWTHPYDFDILNENR
jgi:hypothetical protein